jgi:hypothetical protein
MSPMRWIEFVLVIFTIVSIFSCVTCISNLEIDKSKYNYWASKSRQFFIAFLLFAILSAIVATKV